MNAQKPSRSDRIDSFVRGLIAVALLAAVVWALVQGGSSTNTWG